MTHHSRAVARGCKSPFLIGDMPFGSYEKNADHALENAIRYVREGKIEGVKLVISIFLIQCTQFYLSRKVALKLLIKLEKSLMLGSQ